MEPNYGVVIGLGVEPTALLTLELEYVEQCQCMCVCAIYSCSRLWTTNGMLGMIS